MTAGMQQHDALRWQGFQGADKGIKPHAVGLCVIPGIGIYLKTCTIKNRDVVLQVGSLTQTADCGK